LEGIFEKSFGCEFLGTSAFIKSSGLDGIDFEQEEYFKLDEAGA
tara:strand:- start:130 stop:261 length:132 start_codon:yes stop_codon:yes gene_type:complete